MEEGIGHDIPRNPHGVPQGAGPEDGQDQIGAVNVAPIAKGLTEVLLVARQAHVGGDVDEAAHADGGIDHHAADIRAEAGDLDLQQVVDRRIHIIDVVEEVGYALIHGLGDDRLVALGDGLDEGVVEVRVELVHPPVVRLEGILGIALILGDGGTTQEEGDEGQPPRPEHVACHDGTSFHCLDAPCSAGCVGWERILAQATQALPEDSARPLSRVPGEQSRPAPTGTAPLPHREDAGHRWR